MTDLQGEGSRRRADWKGKEIQRRWSACSDYPPCLVSAVQELHGGPRPQHVEAPALAQHPGSPPATVSNSISDMTQHVHALDAYVNHNLNDNLRTTESHSPCFGKLPGTRGGRSGG